MMSSSSLFIAALLVISATSSPNKGPNAPGRTIVWYRNETTMLVLWQPPHPPGIYSHYRVSIDPKDAVNSVLTVEKDGDPPGPAQAPFHGLVPGRAYNITVETVSGNMISQPTTQQYRTIPLSPRNVTFDQRHITSDSFIVAWQAPKNHVEFEKYSLSIGADTGSPLLIGADQPREAQFSFNLEPGHFYTVLVKTISGNVASWPTSGNVTTRPLRVTDLVIEKQALTGGVLVSWTSQLSSKQDSYKIVYQEQGSYNGDSRTDVVTEEFAIAELYPGRNYTVSVSAVSNGIESAETVQWILTSYKPPVDAKPPGVDTVDVSDFLPPGYKAPEEEAVKPLVKTVDVLAFLPPGYKPPVDATPPVIDTLDVSDFLPPGYKQQGSNDETSKQKVKIEFVDMSSYFPPGDKGTPEKYESAPAVPVMKTVDASAFLPSGYKPPTEESDNTSKIAKNLL